MNNWKFSDIWNESLINGEPREVRGRDRIWASELGGAFIDRWYKMHGKAFSNPYDKRTLRKFEAGRVFEWIAQMVLTRAGVIRSAQDYVSFQYPDKLEVSGKLDFLVGGEKIDWERAKKEANDEFLPGFMKRATNRLIDHFSSKYPDGMETSIIEIKSVGSMMFHRYDLYHKADPRHEMQLYHYLKGTNIPSGRIVYISKDDLCMAEVPVSPSEELENRYLADISEMSRLFVLPDQPEKEKPVVFDTAGGRFSVNWKIGYSNYLTLIYGFKDQAEVDARFSPQVARWNRVLGRCVQGKRMTKDNLGAIEDIKKDFPDFDNLIESAKKSKELEFGEGVK